MRNGVAATIAVSFGLSVILGGALVGSIIREQNEKRAPAALPQPDMSVDALTCRLEMRRVTACGYGTCDREMDKQYRDCMELRRLQQ